MLALAGAVCFPQTYSSAGRMFAASRSVWITTDKWVRFHTDEFDEIPYKLDSTENPRYPTLL